MPQSIAYSVFFLSSKLGCFKKGDSSVHFNGFAAVVNHNNRERELLETVLELLLSGTETRPEAYTGNAPLQSLVKVPGLPASLKSPAAQALLSLTGVDSSSQEALNSETRDAKLTAGGVHGAKPEEFYASLVFFETLN
jgi:hypothetical protein